MIKKYIYVLAFLLTGSLFAHNLEGIVRDNDTGAPIEGVLVFNEGTGDSTYTDVSGHFELGNVTNGDVIYFTGLGYERKSIAITDSNGEEEMDIRLTPAAVSLDQVELVSKVNILTSIVDVDVQNSPVKSAQEILRKVPGLIIGQHAGGGKAEQLFLRGFDVDHGTDIAIEVDGLPVNLPSHAHGQGYADLHFVIPEVIDNIDFGKGPYYAHKGNFNTAGYVALKTKKRIDENLISIEVGQFNTIRALSLIKVVDNEFSDAYIGSELVLTDGVFESPQNFNRLNIMGRYAYDNQDDESLTVTLSHFQSRWNASGQIPVRAVEQGLIGRFGAIDDTEGGITGRTNFWVNHSKELSHHGRLTSKAFVSKYDFELYSNFTFFLVDPVNGDQIRQKEKRTIIGAESVYNYDFSPKAKNTKLSVQAGIGFRYDDNNDVELSRTRNRRETLSRLAFGDIDEVNGYSFVSLNYKKNKWRFNPGIRLDYFSFGYTNFLSPTFDDQRVDDVIVTPKLNVIYTPNKTFQLFGKVGLGYHSNDSRVVTANTGQETLPSAFGADLGTIIKPVDRMVINASLWSLALEQEFVYVGDEAVVEPSGRSQRFGVDFGLRYQFTKWLYGNVDLNYAYARSIDEPEGEDFIPLAPDFTSSAGLFINDLGKFSGGLTYRYVDTRPANEDNSIEAEGYFVTDLTLNYSPIENLSFGLIVENLFDTEWNETQFATETRLFNEVNPVEEITFTPGTPFFARIKASYRF